MALPLTDISLDMVRDTLGSGSNDVGTNFLHPNVNEYGFAHPSPAYQNAVWGKPASARQKLSPSDPNYTQIANLQGGFWLDFFRGYDHNWIAYTGGAVEKFGTTYEEAMKIRVNILLAHEKLESKPSASVTHTFKVEFARSATSFDLGSATVVYSSLSGSYPYVEFDIQPLYPPDYETNGALAQGSTFYVKSTHLSSPDRRWLASANDTTISAFTVPSSQYTNIMTYQNFTVIGIKKTTNPTVISFSVSADIYADLSAQRTINITGTMSNTSGYTSNVYNLYDNSVVIPKNTTQGTPSFVKQVMFDFSGTTLSNYVVAGNTVYGKIVASSGEQYSGSTVVTANPPQ